VKSLQRLKFLLQPKILRLLALGLVLLGSVLLLIQDNYGTHYSVVYGSISVDREDKAAFITVRAANSIEHGNITVHASRLLLRSIEKAGDGAEFLAVVHQGKDKLFCERIYVLAAPETPGLTGPRNDSGKRMTLVVGTRPELVAMVGLDKFGYQLDQPVWAKRKMPGAVMAYAQNGTLDAVKAIMDGENQDFSPNVYLLDAQERIVGIRKTGRSLLTMHKFLRLSAVILYAAAVAAGLGSLIAYKWSAIVRAGRRIWDHVSIRRRKVSS